MDVSTKKPKKNPAAAAAPTPPPQQLIVRVRQADGTVRRVAFDGAASLDDLRAESGAVDELQPGVERFLELLQRANVPMAVMDGKKRFSQLCVTLDDLGVARYFENSDSPT